MTKGQKTSGVILIHKTTIIGTDYWGASFFKGEPTGIGLEVADRTLVSTSERAGKSRKTCVVKAREMAARMGYPNAEVRSSSDPDSVVDPEDDVHTTCAPGF